MWIHHRYATLSVYQAAEEQAWDDIAAVADGVVAELGQLELTSLADGTAGLARLSGLLRAGLVCPSCQVTVVDRQWRVLVEWPTSGVDPQLHHLPGRTVSWRETINPAGPVGEQVRGRLDMPEGAHIALAYPMRHGQGHILVHLAVRDIKASLPTVARSLAVAGCMTLLWTCMLLSIVGYLILSRMHDTFCRRGEESERKALQQSQDLVRTRDAMILGLVKLADSRDPETGDHLERMSLYASSLASALTRHPEFSGVVTPTFVRLIELSSSLHDIGKVGVEDAILCKPGPLTHEERISMQRHTTIGGECIRNIEQRLGSSNFLQMARQVALYHHERWDGRGYPAGLKGEEIPLAARITAMADAYDAMAAGRVYRAARPHDQCIATIREDAGKHFDPGLVEVLLNIEQRFRGIARQYENTAHVNADSAKYGAPRQAGAKQEIPVPVGPLDEA